MFAEGEVRKAEAEDDASGRTGERRRRRLGKRCGTESRGEDPPLVRDGCGPGREEGRGAPRIQRKREPSARGSARLGRKRYSREGVAQGFFPFPIVSLRSFALAPAADST